MTSSRREMPQRVGSATLPLHGGKAPKWLFGRMVQLAPEIVEAIVLEHGRSALLQRLSDPFWFQAFGCVLGFDWHSSGVTTTVCGALKEGLAPRSRDLGIYVAGGKGRASRRTPFELENIGMQLGVDGARLAYNSRMAAKVDSAAVQDGFGIYHHSFFLSSDGEWAVVQQGMRAHDRSARRYHWLGSSVSDFVNEPHAAIASDANGQSVLNMVAAESSAARTASAEFARVEPRFVDREIARVITLALPDRHWVEVEEDINPIHLRKVLLSTYEAAPQNFEQLLAVRGVGPKAVRALALVADVVYGSPASTRDPARFSFAHGGKDGHPYPVNRRVYDHSVEWLRDAVAKARIGRTDRLDALKRLAAWSSAVALVLAFTGSACSTATGRTAAKVQASAESMNSAAVAKARADSIRHPYTAADVEFMSHMISHHAQAMVMARWAPTHGASPSVQRLAERVSNAQQDEINTMQQWLRDRLQTVPQATATGGRMKMNGVEHEMLMPGMLTQSQLTQLDQARGPEFDFLFLRFMIQHHRGAVSMVKDLFASYGAGQDETVFKFASDVNVDQSTEIARMERMLDSLITGTASPQ